MTNRPIFVATHPRACSTAFERVFITRRDILECHHEPFGDPFYFGPENLSPRFKEDEAGRVESGYADLTFGDVMDQLLNQKEGKRVFTKDMAYYLFSPQGRPTYLFPSLVDRLPGGKSKEAVEVEVKENGSGGGGGGGSVRKLLQEPGNPTAVPREMLRKFHFAFLIRHPRRSVPSYYRCHIPPLVDVTGFSEFLPEESGYAELRRLFDFLRGEGMVGPGRAAGEAATNGTTTNGVNGTNGTANGVNGTNGTNGTANGVNGHAEHQQERVPITLVDADDLLDRPEEVVRAFCRDVGIDFQPVMLDWDEESLAQSSEAFKKWDGFHDDALGSTSLKPRTHAQKTKTEEQEDEEWTQKFGAEAAKVIRQTVNDNIEHYEYLKQFKLKI